MRRPERYDDIVVARHLLPGNSNSRGVLSIVVLESGVTMKGSK